MTPIENNSISNRRRIGSLALVPVITLTGCARAPSFSIAGSFFPDWIFCCLIGIVLAVVVYRLLVRLKMESEVQAAVLIYPCIALSCAVSLWLVFFG
jgi:YtcA family